MSEQESIIHVLPDTLANKIAAGEVVQRPSSVAKELLENAIDAGADTVTLILKKAGRELVQVIDNGCGMSAVDAVACFQRHATSKINAIEDLQQLYTLGFRGEALASIASVAQVELRTKRMSDPAGILIQIDGGEGITQEPCAAPSGTSISVRNLFYNVPARRNFLKSNATEFKHLVETFQFIALSNPEVGFRLVHDGHEVHNLPPAAAGTAFQDALRERVMGLFGDKTAGQLIPVRESTSYMTIDGFVAKPEFSRRTRGEQFFFVNQRYIKNRLLDHAVSNAYGEMLPKGSYPFFTLFLHIDPKHVDVNVHPTKAEVKFDDERGVYGFILAVIRKALGDADITPNMGFDRKGRLVEQTGDGANLATPPAPRAVTPAPNMWSDPPVANPMRDYSRLPGQNDMFTAPSVPSVASALPDDVPPEVVPLSQAVTLPATSLPEGAEVTRQGQGEVLLWQLHDKYILARIRSGVMIVDQHAAHERILYEKALKAMESQFGMTQQLLFPHTLEFSPADFELLSELGSDLKGLGFDIEFFGGRSVIVRGVPADIRVGDEREILDGILQQYKSYVDQYQIHGRDNLAKSVSCRTAIKTGKKLSLTEMQVLIDQLFMCKMPYACPHGRPTMVKISLDELDRRFGRVGHLERE